MKLSRHVIVFGSSSVNLGGFTEEIAAAALDRTLADADADVVALRAHNSEWPLGRRSAGTLALAKTSRGLRADLDLDPEVSFVSDMIRLIQRRDAAGSSFGFRAVSDIWTLRGDTPHRIVTDLVLHEISFAVSFPAYRATADERSDDAETLQRQRFQRAMDTRLRLVR